LRKPLASAGVAAAIALACLAAGSALPPPNLERALATQRALAAQEPTAEHFNDLGNLLLLAGREQEAEDAYGRALELDEQMVSAHYNLALLLQQRGRSRSALRHLREVVAVDPEHARAWFQIGALHEAAGAEGPAVRAYARAYLLEPGLSFADENPQVLDSKLTTRALLVANQALPDAGDAPLDYAEPRRIAGLLLPAPPPATAPTPPGGDTTVAVPSPPSQLPASPAPEIQASGRVLSAQDLDPGSSVGEVSGGAAGSRGSVTHLPAGREATDYSELLRQRLLQQQQMQEEEQYVEEGVVVEESGSPSSGMPGGAFATDPASSGRLEYRLEDQFAAFSPEG
jgi:hypothetical protein